jgi:hypothetical protein
MSRKKYRQKKEIAGMQDLEETSRLAAEWEIRMGEK